MKSINDLLNERILIIDGAMKIEEAEKWLRPNLE